MNQVVGPLLMLIVTVLLMMAWRVAGFGVWTAGCYQPQVSPDMPAPFSAASEALAGSPGFSDRALQSRVAANG